MCLSILFKKPVPLIDGMSDYITGCDPSPEYLNGEIPTYTIDGLIEHLDFRKSIHESYYGQIIQEETLQGYAYGDANFHLWAMEGYDNAIYYLKVTSKSQL